MDENERLQMALGHRFAEPALLEEALTHRSAGGRHNERLEFLGDAVLGLVVAERLFRDRPAAREGALSRQRARLVRRETLAEIARGLQLGSCLRLGSGELKNGGQQRDSILADALEAVIGAVYLDAGVQATRGLLERLLAPQLAALPSEHDLRDSKTRLQELLQARQLALPEYRILAESGLAHRPSFTVECGIAALGLKTTAEGHSRRAAEQEAARRALERVSQEGDA